MFRPALGFLLEPSGCLQTDCVICRKTSSGALDFKCFPVPSRRQAARAHGDESWLFALAVPNTACRGNAGYARLDRQPDDSVRGSRGVLGGLGTLVRHLHCPSDVRKRNHSLLYTPSGRGGGVEVGSARSGQRPIFHLYRGLSVAGDSPRLGCTQVLAKCSHPELNPKRTSTLCPARSSAGVWQRLARLSESHSVLPRG